MSGGHLLNVGTRAAFLGALLTCALAHAGEVAVVLVNGAGLSKTAQQDLREAATEAIAESGHAPKDVSPLASGIFEAGMLVPEFDRSPPEGWPKALLPLWEEGNAACREQLGAPGGSPKRRLLLAAAAVECQRILSESLYGELLNALSPDQVVELTVRPARGGANAPLRLTGRLFVPGGKEGSARMLEREAKADGLAKAGAAVAKALLKGEGEAANAPRLRPLPVRPTATLEVLESETARPRLEEVRIDDACQQRLSTSLKLSPTPDESRFVKSLVTRWERSVTRGAPGKTPPSCALRGYPTRINVASQTVDAVELILTCGDKEFRAAAPVDPILRRRHESLHDVLTFELVRQLAASLCD